MAVRITCIKKDGGDLYDPHEGIIDFGWINEQTRATGQSTLIQMMVFLENQNGRAYVKDSFGKITHVGIVKTNRRTKYLRTYSDGKWTDSLLSLPECVG